MLQKQSQQLTELEMLKALEDRKRKRKDKAVPEGASVEEIRRVMVQVEQEMMEASEELRFEQAADLRDRLAELREALGDA